MDQKTVAFFAPSSGEAEYRATYDAWFSPGEIRFLLLRLLRDASGEPIHPEVHAAIRETTQLDRGAEIQQLRVLVTARLDHIATFVDYMTRLHSPEELRGLRSTVLMSPADAKHFGLPYVRPPTLAPGLR